MKKGWETVTFLLKESIRNEISFKKGYDNTFEISFLKKRKNKDSEFQKKIRNIAA